MPILTYFINPKQNYMSKKTQSLDQVSGQVYVVNETTKQKEMLTPARMANQIEFISIASAYNLMSMLIIKVYEKKPRELTDYNLFIKYNMGQVKVYLTKEEAEVGGCVAAPYLLSKGTLAPIETIIR
ncbi:hypothetical protein EZS27_028488, partial [termite gut metagenome]